MNRYYDVKKNIICPELTSRCTIYRNTGQSSQTLRTIRVTSWTNRKS